MRIEDVLLAPGRGGFYYDDHAAISAGAAIDGFFYHGTPATPGFPQVRMPAQSLSIGLHLSDGSVAWGDMMSVQYSGAGGRDPLFDATGAEHFVRDVLVPRLVGLNVEAFRGVCDAVLAPDPRIPLAIAYGLSQSLLKAVALSRRVSMAEVICAEFGLPIVARPVPLYAQSGDDRYANVDKMILKEVSVLPHGLFNTSEKFGGGGESFREYATWVAARIESIGRPRYRPVLHFDVYGCLGEAFGRRIGDMADFIARLADDLHPYELNIECPADFGSREAQIDGYASLAAALAAKGCAARIVADERCNTLDDIRAFAAAGAAHMIQIKMPDVGSLADSVLAVCACHDHGILAYLGGSCAETDLSARASVHVAVATQADMLLAKPGMGVDEALTIVGNEQSRLVSWLGRDQRGAA